MRVQRLSRQLEDIFGGVSTADTGELVCTGRALEAGLDMEGMKAVTSDGVRALRGYLQQVLFYVIAGFAPETS